LDGQIQRLRLEVSIILAGVDQSGAHIYSIEDPGTSVRWDRLGYNAIGSGQHHAMMMLLKKGQDRDVGINECVFKVYCAKRTSEVAAGVGTATEMRVITRKGVQALDKTQLGTLEKIYQAWSQPKVDDVKEMVSALPYETVVIAHDRQGSA